jgi:hypothetical protein
MYKTFGLSVVFCIVLSVVCFQPPKQCYGDDEINIGIDLAQSIINLQSNIEIITFHTSIALYEVNCATVTLTADTDQPVSMPIYLCRSDSRGRFLAEILMEKIKDIRDNLEIGEENLFVLEGETKDGAPFYGSQLLLVEDNKPKGRP